MSDPQGRTAPSAMEIDSSGTSAASSTVRTLPVPAHVGQAPPPTQTVEAPSGGPGHGWLILRGKAGLSDEVTPEIRQAGYDHLTDLGEDYDGPDDPTLVFFSVEEPQAWICDHKEWKPIEL